MFPSHRTHSRALTGIPTASHDTSLTGGPSTQNAGTVRAQPVKPEKNEPATILTPVTLPADFASSNWVDQLHQLYIHQPQLAEVVSLIDWLLPNNPDEKLTIGNVQLSMSTDRFPSTPPSCDCCHLANAPGDEQPVSPDSRSVQFSRQNRLASITQLFRTHRQTPQSQTHSKNASAYIAEQCHLRMKAIAAVFEFIAQDIQQEVSTDATDPEKPSDITAKVKSELMHRLKTRTTLQTIQNHQSEAYLGFFYDQMNIGELLGVLSTLPPGPNNRHSLPCAVRKAILQCLPQAIPVLSMTSMLLHAEGQQSKPPTERFILFDQSDYAYQQQLMSQNPVAYASTFLPGINRLFIDDTSQINDDATPMWRIESNDGSIYLSRFSDIICHVLQGLEHTHTDSNGNQWPAHWPQSIHQSATPLFGPEVPQCVRLNEQKRAEALDANQTQAAQQREAQRQANIASETARLEREENVRRACQAENCPSSVSWVMSKSAPSTDLAQNSTDERLTLGIAGTSNRTERETVLAALNQHFDPLNISYQRLPLNHNGDIQRDNLCWLRAGWISVLHQAANATDLAHRSWVLQNVFQNTPNYTPTLLYYLKDRYDKNAPFCLGTGLYASKGDGGARLAPGLTLDDLISGTPPRQTGGSVTASDLIEYKLAALNRYTALAFRFDSKDYACEAERSIFPGSGGGPELPLSIHRALGLPCLIIERHARQPGTLHVRCSLPKGHTLSAHWQSHYDAYLATQTGCLPADHLNQLIGGFKHIPVLYLECLTPGDSIGHYTLYLPKVQTPPFVPVSPERQYNQSTRIPTRQTSSSVNPRSHPLNIEKRQVQSSQATPTLSLTPISPAVQERPSTTKESPESSPVEPTTSNIGLSQQQKKEKPAAAIQMSETTVSRPSAAVGHHAHLIGQKAESSWFVGASKDLSSAATSHAHLAPRLGELLKQSQTHLVSFGSEGAGQRLQRALSSAPVSAKHSTALKSNSSSLIEQICCLAATTQLPVKLDAALAIGSIDIDPLDSSASGKCKALSGRITLILERDGQTIQRVIPFIEFFPAYDGVALTAGQLVDCHTQLQAWERSFMPALTAEMAEGGRKPAATSTPSYRHFYSAAGIGRSASLAMLCTIADTYDASATTLSKGQGAVATQVRELLEDARRQGNPRWVHTRQQAEALEAACRSWLTCYDKPQTR